MNELNRQAYLASFGIENYMPRWRLPAAPVPVACLLPTIEPAIMVHAELTVGMTLPIAKHSAFVAPAEHTFSIATDMLADIGEQKKPAVSINAASILGQLETAKKAPVVQPFTLSIWRPAAGFLIVDSRNTRLALPTELLLHNILRALSSPAGASLNEEILSWPMIENSFVSRTENDARNELQTWLAVENELRPINKMWLMGNNASRYLIDADMDNAFWQTVPLAGVAGSALILPSLNELLQQPMLKAKLWACLG